MIRVLATSRGVVIAAATPPATAPDIDEASGEQCPFFEATLALRASHNGN